MQVGYKKGSLPVYKHKKKPKPFFSTVAVAFNTYNTSLAKADVLFDAFSTERMEAQVFALNHLRKRLKDLNLNSFMESMDYESSYQFPSRFAEVA